MEREPVFSPLHQHAWEQLRLLQECQRRAEAAGDATLVLAWTGAFLRVSNAMTETTKVLARIEAAPALSEDVLSALALPLPKLPRLPEEEGDPPSQNPKTTSGQNHNSVKGILPRLR
ncbi:MAG TPA: hypothetical protein VGM17_03135, partial [Rhizomicrobium sp.]